ncbi:MAG: hypothetical protein RSH52_11625 [Janthinobacterium sp.]
MALRRAHGQADGAGGQGRFFSLGGMRVLYGKADLAAATLLRSTKGQDDFSVILLFFALISPSAISTACRAIYLSSVRQGVWKVARLLPVSSCTRVRRAADLTIQAACIDI